MSHAKTKDIEVNKPANKKGGGGAGRAVLECAGLSKVFRDFWMRSRVHAVDGVSFSAMQGEVLGLLGPNGSGKSTTIKLILGLLYPTAGRVLVFGKNPGNVGVKKRVGYLPEESYLYRFLNARETLDYYGRLFGLTRHQRHTRTDMLLEMVGLTAVQRRPVGEYSKGMQRRIGLAQALINDPDLLILDEPTTGMDPIGSRQIKDLIVELSRRGKTVVLCSHLLADVEDVCDRVAIMFGGKIRTMGRVDELLVQQGVTTLQTSLLDVRTIEQIESLLEKQGKRIDKIDQPRQKLETLFLEIVNQAHEQGVQTSGARRAGRIAEFLRVEGISTGSSPSAPGAQQKDRSPSGPVPPSEEQEVKVSEEDAGMIDSLSGNWQSNCEETMVGMPVEFSDVEVGTPGASGPDRRTDAPPDRSLLDHVDRPATSAADPQTPGQPEPSASTGSRLWRTPAPAAAPDVTAEDVVAPIADEGVGPVAQPAGKNREYEPVSDVSHGVDGDTSGDSDEAPDMSFLDALAGVEPYEETEDDQDDQSPKQDRDA